MVPTLSKHSLMAVLEGNGGGIPPQPAEVPGFENWDAIKGVTNEVLRGETDPARKAIIGTALSIAAAAAPIPVAGWIVSIGSLVVGAILSALGIRGRTQHVPRQTAIQKAGEFAQNIRTVYDAMPADAKAAMLDSLFAWDVNMFARFRSWWGGIIGTERMIWKNLDPATVDANGNLVPSAVLRRYQLHGGAGQFVSDIVSFYYWVIMASADAESVEENMQTWYFNILSNMVLKPLDSFMLEKYNATVAQYRAMGGTALKPIPTVNYAMFGTVASIAGLLLAFGRR